MNKTRVAGEATQAAAAFLKAGLNPTQAVRSAVACGSWPEDIGRDIQRRLARGQSLASALGQHPDLFGSAYVGVVAVGERSGALAQAFGALAEQLERQSELRSRLLSAALYPMILACAGVVSILAILFFIVPRFAELLVDAGADLPPTTVALLAVSAFVRANWLLLLIGVVGAGVALTATVRNEVGSRRLAAWALRLPLIGPLRRQLVSGRVARFLGMLLGSGAPLLTALSDTAKSIADPVAADDLMRIRGLVREGSSLDKAFLGSDFFPKELGQLVAVGARASQLPDFLLRAAEIFETRTERTIQRLAVLLEPAMIVVFGGIVALVALSLLQAIYGVNAGSLG